MFLKSRRNLKLTDIESKKLSKKEMRDIHKRLKELGYSSNQKKNDIPEHVKIDFINTHENGAYAAMQILEDIGTPFELSKEEERRIETYKQEKTLQEIAKCSSKKNEFDSKLEAQKFIEDLKSEKEHNDYAFGDPNCSTIELDYNRQYAKSDHDAVMKALERSFPKKDDEQE